MLELSLHILDVVENALNASATLTRIGLFKDENRDTLKLTVSDNGSGMSDDVLRKVTDPFYTTRTTRRVGLGLSLLKETAERTDGYFQIESKLGEGTSLEVCFGLSHIDRAPLGDMLGTLMSLIVGREDVDFIYRQEVVLKKDDTSGSDNSESDSSEIETFEIDTREIKEALDGVSFSTPDVINFLKENISDGLAQLGQV